MNTLKRSTNYRLGDYLVSLRAAKGLSQKEVARRLGLAHTYYNKVERGTVPPPSPLVLDQLVGLLGADRDRLYALAGKSPPDVQKIIDRRPELWPLIRALNQGGGP